MGVVAVVIFLPFCFEEFSASALRGKETNLLSQKPERHRPTPRKLVKQYSMVSVIDGRFLAASDGRKSFWSKLRGKVEKVLKLSLKTKLKTKVHRNRTGWLLSLAASTSSPASSILFLVKRKFESHSSFPLLNDLLSALLRKNN